MKMRSLLFFFFSLILLSCSSKEQKHPSPPPVDVTELIITPTTIPVIFDYVGFTESSHPVEIRTKVEGYLEKINYVEGQLVHQNDLLFQLDSIQFQAKVDDAKANLAKQEAALENANSTVNRLMPLYEQKAASKKDLDNAISNKLSAEASVQSAEAQVKDAEIDLSYTAIHSPITGFADRSKFQQGALISPGSNSLLTTVSVFDPIWVSFTISDFDILRIAQQEAEKTIVLPHTSNQITLPKENQWDAELILGDGSIFSHRGFVNFRAPTYDQSTGTLQNRAVFPNPEGMLRPGQFVKIKIYGATRPNAILVPRRALLQKKNGMFVYLIDEENKVIAQDVETGEWYGDNQVITKGLKAGDRVVADGINKIRQGSNIKVVNSPAFETPPKTEQTPLQDPIE